ncbi:hypothetical protein F5Y12DRAFT_739101 [Xylaria sp. FL1777]|nr:hypothetical protein F5Y12DRAFT_739101 [Xylaria sp. FL1777]
MLPGLISWSDNDNTMFNHQSGPTDRGSMNTRHRAALACLSCRSLHARCGGQIPTCNRCKEEDRVCRYPKSRRRRTLEYPLPSPASDIAGSLSTQASETPGTGRLSTAEPSEIVPLSTLTPHISGTPNAAIADASSTDAFDRLAYDPGSHELIDSYYRFFHKAHPFAPEKPYVLSQMNINDAAIKPLYAAMCYVGSLNRQSPPRQDLERLALQYMQPAQVLQCDVSPAGIYQISVLLLLAIASYGLAELDKASELLGRAISLSVDMGMNRVDWVNSLHNSELKEIWKRIYWYLYIVETALTRSDSGLRSEPLSEFPLPCEKDTSQQATLAEFDRADFEDECHGFSSLTYLIALVRTGRCIKRFFEQSKDQPDRTVAWADALLMNWKLHLPSDKEEIFTENGEMDDVMFQSHILFHSLCIYVHTSIPSKTRGSNELLHRRRKREAAEGAVSLLTLHPCLRHMSPLNITLLSGIAMSNLCTSLTTDPGFHARDNLRLILGIFKQLGETWKAAKQEAQALKAMARLSYSELGNPSQETHSSPQISLTDDFANSTSCLFSETTSPVQDSDLGNTPDERRNSLTMSFSESSGGPSTEAYVLSWDF